MTVIVNSVHVNDYKTGVLNRVDGGFNATQATAMSVVSTVTDDCVCSNLLQEVKKLFDCLFRLSLHLLFHRIRLV